MAEQRHGEQISGVNQPDYNQNGLPNQNQMAQQAHRQSPQQVFRSLPAHHQHPSPPIVQPTLASTDAIMLQILQQLQHQQAVTNQLLQQQEAIFQNAMQSIKVSVPPNPEVILDSLAGNIKEFVYDPENNLTFSAWYSRYEDLFLKDAERLDDSAKVRLLLRRIGTQEHYRFVSYILPNTPKDFSFVEIIEKMQVLFSTRESAIKRRYSTLTVSKSPTEDYVSYACRVNKMCVEFELTKMSEAQFKCLMYVCGLKSEKDSEVRTRLLAKIENSADITLENLIQECQLLINLKNDTAMIENPLAPAVQAIKGNNKRHKFYRKPYNERYSSKQQQQQQQRTSPNTPCWNCGALHYAKYCGYQQHKCTSCQQTGHKDGYCSSAKRARRGSHSKQQQFSTRTISASINSIQSKRRFVWVKINDIPVRLQLDTASDITIVSEQTWRRIGKPKAVPTIQCAKTASGEKLDLEFEFMCTVSINDSVSTGNVFICKNSLNLLGIDFIDKLNLWSLPMDKFCNNVSSNAVNMSYWQKAYPKLFNPSLGLCTKTKISFTLKEACKPVFRPKRPVSYAMLSTVNEELDRLERLNIISRIDFSEWAAPIVVVRKSNGSIRICGDYSTGLNDRLLPHQYPLPLPQDIFSKLANCTIFSQIDLSDAFLQLEVEESSRKLLTVNTHRGLYQYNRLPPGIKAAPGAFQQLMDVMLAGIQCTSGYLDDVIVGGETVEQHNQNLHTVLQRIQEFGFTIRPEKCSFGQKQIKYLGHLLDSQGLRPDPSKIKAICEMTPPRDLTGVRSFLGAINFYGKFVPNIRSLRYPLDELLKSTPAKFEWTKTCQKAFDDFKSILSSDLLLTHYDPTKEIVVSADASSIGVGATICHKFPDGSIKVVQHAARSLTSAEQKYSQPDREGLAIVFAITKFHKYVFGRHFRLQTDHAPLLRIFGSKKGIPVYTANRLQRWALTLLAYDFSIEYIATDKFGNADILSRLINQHVKPDEDVVVSCTHLEEDLRAIADSTITQLPLSFRMIERATLSDPLLRKVHRYIRDGWPSHRSNIKDWELLRYYDRQEALSVIDGCIMFSDRLVIPMQYRKRCLNQLHKGHPGMQRMKAIARSFVYWPGLDEEIISYVRACQPCASASKSPPKAVPEPWPKPVVPWQRVHVDYAGPLEGTYYLVIIDAYSKWPEIFPTKQITTKATVNLLHSLFANKGMPEVLVSDNGTQFCSADFEEFCTENGVQHIKTPPFHPQSNGQAERFVDTFKRAIKKLQAGKCSLENVLNTFLLTYRTTPNPNAPEGKSPAELMYNRQLRTSLDLLRAPRVNPPTKRMNDRSQPRSFLPKDAVYTKVYAKNKWSWTCGIVLERVGRVLYNVWINDSKMIRSHINQLRSRISTVNHSKNPTQHPRLPLEILLQQCNLNNKQTANQQLTQLSTSSSELSVQLPEQSSELTLVPIGSETSSSEVSLSDSSPTTSGGFQSAVESTPPVVQFPRRSSRARRPPERFNAYQRY